MAAGVVRVGLPRRVQLRDGLPSVAMEQLGPGHVDVVMAHALGPVGVVHLDLLRPAYRLGAVAVLDRQCAPVRQDVDRAGVESTVWLGGQVVLIRPGPRLLDPPVGLGQVTGASGQHAGAQVELHTHGLTDGGILEFAAHSFEQSDAGAVVAVL